MEQKGFTLVELIGIILVLAAICLVSFPAIINMTKTNKKTSYESFEKNICLAAESFLNSTEQLNPQEQLYVDVSDLINLKYLDGNLKNPNTNNTIEQENGYVSVIFSSDKSIECKYNK